MPKSASLNTMGPVVRAGTSHQSGSRRSAKGAALLALQLCKDQPHIPLKQACRMISTKYRANCSSVWQAMMHIRRRERDGPRRDPRWKLTAEEEETVIGMILAFDRSSMPLKARQIRDAIQHVFKVKVSATWISEFKQRHKKYLRTRTTKGIQTRRLKTTSPAEVKDWLDRLDLFLKRHHFPAKARFNIDETRVIPAMKQKYLVGAPGMNDLNKSNVRAGRIKCYGTCLPFISADGDVFMVSYVLKSKQETYFHEVIPDEPRGRSGRPHFYAITKSGFLNKTLFQDTLLQFEKEWHLKNPGLDCIIFLDNCSVHRSDNLVVEDIDANFVLSLATKGIWLYFFPPNTTAWLQPLDDAAFGLFKLELGRKHEDICFSSAALLNQDGSLNLQHVIDAESNAFSPKAIKRSWMNTGMSHPEDASRVDAAKIMRRASETFGVPKRKVSTLIERSAQGATRIIRSTQPLAKKESVKIPVEIGRMYQAHELRCLHQEHQTLLAEKAEQKRQKAQQREEMAQSRSRAREKRRIHRETQETAKEQRREHRRVQQKERAKAQTRKERANHCRKCQRTWKGGTGWVECEYCALFSLCGPCSKNIVMMAGHERNCPKRPSGE